MHSRPFSHSHNSPMLTQGTEGATMITGAPSSFHCRTAFADTPNAAPISFQPCAKLAEVREMNVSCLSIAGLPALCGRQSPPGRTCLADSGHMPPPFNPAITAYPCEPYAGIVIIWRVMLPFAHRPALRTTARINFSQIFLVHSTPLNKSTSPKLGALNDSGMGIRSAQN